MRKAQRTAVALDQEPEVRYPVTIDPNYSFVVSASNGSLIGQGSDYSTIRTQTDADYVQTSLPYTPIGQIYYDEYSEYEADRLALFFDTSSLGSGATISAATLKIRGFKGTLSSNYNIQIQNGQPDRPSDPLVAADYDMDWYSGNGGYKSTSSFSTTSYNSITLTAEGRGWINKNGTTKLMLRSSRDINGNTPSGNEIVNIYEYDKGTDYWPLLSITYSGSLAGTLAEAVDNTALTFTTGGSTSSAYWIWQNAISHSGGDAAISGLISNSQQTWMQTTVSGTGTVRFYWKVDSEEDCDYLNFYIGGVLQSSISGELDWQQQTYDITTAGSHTLKWQYLKNSEYSMGRDAGWVDKVEWVPLPPTNVSATDKLYYDKVRITWTASAGATGYTVFRVDAGGMPQQIGTTPALQFDDTGLPLGEEYKTIDYWVKAYNLSGDSDLSNSDSGQLKDIWYAGNWRDTSNNAGYGASAEISTPSAEPYIKSGLEANWISTPAPYWVQTGWIYGQGFSGAASFTEYNIPGTNGHQLIYVEPQGWNTTKEYMLLYDNTLGWEYFFNGDYQGHISDPSLAPPKNIEVLSEIQQSSQNELNADYSNVTYFDNTGIWHLFDQDHFSNNPPYQYQKNSDSDFRCYGP